MLYWTFFMKIAEGSFNKDQKGWGGGGEGKENKRQEGTFRCYPPPLPPLPISGNLFTVIMWKRLIYVQPSVFVYGLMWISSKRMSLHLLRKRTRRTQLSASGSVCVSSADWSLKGGTVQGWACNVHSAPVQCAPVQCAPVQCAPVQCVPVQCALCNGHLYGQAKKTAST
jgi:hypothetical protein